MAKIAAKPPIIESWDRYNQELVNHVHPPDWRNPDPASPPWPDPFFPG
jgi:hypothetical protein